MDAHTILIELLAIKLWEHAPMGSGAPNTMSWSQADPEDRAMYRDLIGSHQTAEGLITELGED